MTPDEVLRRLVHLRGIERPRHLPDAACVEGGRRPPVQDAIEVMALRRRKPRVEAVRYDLREEHADRLRPKMRVCSITHRIGPPIAIEIDVCHLVCRVHARIGAPGAVDAHRLAGEALDRLLDSLLNGAPVELALPSREGRAVIFHDEHVAGHF